MNKGREILSDIFSFSKIFRTSSIACIFAAQEIFRLVIHFVVIQFVIVFSGGHDGKA